MQNCTTYYLEMNDKALFSEKSVSHGLLVVEAEIDEYRFNRFLYQLVGSAWQWVDKLSVSDSDWKAYVQSPSVKTWVGYYKGSIAGYFELIIREGGDTEIEYFGLAEAFIGKGFGGYFLSQAIKTAWGLPDTKRVIVHTCSLDHPAALNNYKSRGFTVYKTEMTLDS